MGRMGRATVVGAISLMVLAASCGEGSGSGSGGAGSPSGAGASGATGATGRYGGGYGGGGGGGATGSSGSGGDGGASVRTVTQVNYQFAPAKVTVTSGDVITVSDTNPSTPHTFTVEGTPIDVSNNPQQSQDVTIDLDPGTYVFFCRFHRSQGMEGTLIVQ